MIGGRGDFMHVKTHGRVTSHIFVKEPEGSSEKILKYLNYTYVRISGPRPGTIFSSFTYAQF